MKSVYVIVLLIILILIIVFKTEIESKLKEFKMSFEHQKIIKSLHPKARALVTDFIREVEKRTGYRVYLTSGYRSFLKQNNLLVNGDTNTTPGNSYHNYGLAFDLNLVKGSNWIKKATPYNIWDNTGIPLIASEYGLRWGGNFSNYDPVHFDFGNYFSIIDLKSLAQSQFGSDVVKVKGNKVNINSLV